MAKKKCKKFRLFKQCRYLPGEIDDLNNLLDLYGYNCHRFRIFNTKPEIDCQPFKLNPFKVMNYAKMRETLFRVYQIDRENKALMFRINEIHRNGGYLDTFNPRAYIRQYKKWHEYERQMKDVTYFNKAMYEMINAADSVYSKKEMDKSWKATEKRLRNMCRYNLVIGKEPDYDLLLTKEPSISCGLDKDLEQEHVRPLCFLDFKVRNGPYLGKIVIELYEDLVPVTCQNFMEICKGEGELTYKNCVLHRIVKGKFIETGDITHNTGRGGTSIYGKTFHEENHVLKHTRAGVVSMKRLPPLSENNSQFIITLTAMQQWDKMHVVLGKVVKGNNVLFKIQDYGRTIGKPYADVLISNCGVIETEENKEDLE